MCLGKNNVGFRRAKKATEGALPRGRSIFSERSKSVLERPTDVLGMAVLKFSKTDSDGMPSQEEKITLGATGFAGATRTKPVQFFVRSRNFRASQKRPLLSFRTSPQDSATIEVPRKYANSLEKSACSKSSKQVVAGSSPAGRARSELWEWMGIPVTPDRLTYGCF